MKALLPSSPLSGVSRATMGLLRVVCIAPRGNTMYALYCLTRICSETIVFQNAQ